VKKLPRIDQGRYVGEAALQVPKIRDAEALVIVAGEVDAALGHLGEGFVYLGRGSFVLAAQELFWAEMTDTVPDWGRE